MRRQGGASGRGRKYWHRWGRRLGRTRKVSPAKTPLDSSGCTPPPRRTTRRGRLGPQSALARRGTGTWEGPLTRQCRRNWVLGDDTVVCRTFSLRAVYLYGTSPVTSLGRVQVNVSPGVQRHRLTRPQATKNKNLLTWEKSPFDQLFLLGGRTLRTSHTSDEAGTQTEVFRVYL